MEISEYQNIFNQEESHFFYVGTHDLVLNLLKGYLFKNGKTDLQRMTILDAGCGTGLLLFKMKKLGLVRGVDISSQAVQLSKKRGLKEIYQSSIEKMPFKDQSFGAIVCIDVLYHQQVGDDLKALQQFYRLLKPGGILVIKVPAFDWLGGKHDRLVQTQRRYDRKQLSSKLTATGFQIKKITYSNMFLLPVVFLKRKLENYLPSALSEGSDIFYIPRLLNRILILVLILERMLLNFVNLPFGVSVIAVAEKPKV
ncbi:MAG: Methyltransferase type 11 [Candidatus Daviesbacteria bacterium GW2011_GWA1_41_61]|uniref:Methyltransferase type 11 n=1 Tax=Candidatus Daviesbacteria bacterium GW2011_GWA2_40_9 TaxID=1618424 RepID=A0A0G0U1N2_9BACT|nr:MAG: Methyltransferase type 11 [Candidatus Daviesbacteria bacterium GW2011_GWC1_40_9]KKR83024.1 MAG: Methyltransferase type 11 [Candidatus Daviesbacteria bacterium GW2011_GWA2_40_9]KKR92949.1 MAG: Methyltransferase type 11 [Candidatus Daviesbacteria bacterium GW2011_GWB1_41_15]KKS15493.1 MAG: Methyltransferase type 11 [Candidatus Daviesbacteria bacterium GW2011_GWA1_41_61]